MLNDIIGRKVRPLNRSFPRALTLCVMVWLTACANLAPSTPQKEGMIVTFRVAGVEEYKIRLTDQADIEIARKLLAGEEAPNIPNGIVVRGDPDVNVGYTWHIDPESVEFVDITMEVCDGLPSNVEKGIITSDRYAHGPPKWLRSRSERTINNAIHAANVNPAA